MDSAILIKEAIARGHDAAGRESSFSYNPLTARKDSLYWEFQPEYDLEEAACNGEFKDLTEEDLDLHFDGLQCSR